MRVRPLLSLAVSVVVVGSPIACSESPATDGEGGGEGEG